MTERGSRDQVTEREPPRSLDGVPWEQMTPEEKRQVNELAQKLPDYPGGPWHLGRRMSGKSAALKLIEESGVVVHSAGQAQVGSMPRWFENAPVVEFHVGQEYVVERFEDLFSPPPPPPTEHLDVTDVMHELWIRLVANIGLLAGVIRPECFGWPPGTRAVLRR